MFISFEGIDGSGKSTQAIKLRDVLTEQGKIVHLLREPGNTAISESIRSILLHSAYHDMSPRAELLLFNAARAQLVESTIRPILARGEIVICDRFADSTIAYQAFGRDIPLSDVQQCIAIATAGLMPDITFYIDVPLEMALERVGNKHKDRMESGGEEFFSKVIRGYEFLCETEPKRVRRIDGRFAIADTHRQIVETLRSAYSVSLQH